MTKLKVTCKMGASILDGLNALAGKAQWSSVGQMVMWQSICSGIVPEELFRMLHRTGNMMIDMRVPVEIQMDE